MTRFTLLCTTSSTSKASRWNFMTVAKKPTTSRKRKRRCMPENNDEPEAPATVYASDGDLPVSEVNSTQGQLNDDPSPRPRGRAVPPRSVLSQPLDARDRRTGPGDRRCHHLASASQRPTVHRDIDQ